MKRKVAIAGVVGVPGRYGGFETLAENLVRYHALHDTQVEFTVFCSQKAYPDRAPRFLEARLDYVALDANGVQSIPYDAASLLRCIRQKQDVVVLLGVSGAIVLPLVRALSRVRIVTNIDGIEWKRAKWSGPARWFLRLSERLAVRWSHVVIADNAAIAEHVQQSYGSPCEVIAYGGDHAIVQPERAEQTPPDLPDLPNKYALALCRIEPENNVQMILEAWRSVDAIPLVFVGNWTNSDYGRAMRAQFGDCEGITLLDPIYDANALFALRQRADLYVHGHSAGGTNPSLVEMMHFGVPVLAHGCDFNRHTTEGKARYFLSVDELRTAVPGLAGQDPVALEIGAQMAEIAQRRYTWERVGEAYFALVAPEQNKP